MPGYSAGKETTKIPAGWLIEKAGWKGKKMGNVGCYEKQALVLVNLGGATGNDVINLANEVIRSYPSKPTIDKPVSILFNSNLKYQLVIPQNWGIVI